MSSLPNIANIDLTVSSKYRLENILEWDEDMVCNWFTELGFGSLVSKFHENKITGDVLFLLNHFTLKHLNIKLIGHRMKILIIIERCKRFLLRPSQSSSKPQPIGKSSNTSINQQAIVSTPSSSRIGPDPVSILQPLKKENTLSRSKTFGKDDVVPSKKRLVKVVGEDNQSRMVDFTGVSNILTFYAKVFQKFGISYDKSDPSSIEKEMENWSFYILGSNNDLVQVPAENLLSIPLDVSSFDEDVPKLYFRSKVKIISKQKLLNFFGEDVPDPSLYSSSSPRSPVVENLMTHTKLQKFFMQRPTSESITDNMSKYFPDVKGYNSKNEKISKGVNSSKLANSTTISVENSRKLSSSNSLSKGSGSSSGVFVIEKKEDIELSTPITPVENEPDMSFDELPAIAVDESPKKDLKSSPSETTSSLKKRKIKWVKGALIGQGSFGNVYLGLHTTTGELMAVKQVALPEVTGPEEVVSKSQLRKKTMVDALHREINLLKELEHPCIVRYLGSESTEKFLNIFLEYVPGGSLSSMIKDYGNLEEPLIKTFTRQTLSGLSYLHGKNIVHRDIKGGNILVDNKGLVRISDFGISKKLSGGNDRGTMISIMKQNRTSSLQGSVFWMSPEVVAHYHYTRKSDIWSVGCLIIEMFSGTHPWPELNQMQAMFKIGSNEIPPIPEDLSEEAKNFLGKCFELNYKDRWTAEELMKHEFLTAEDEAEETNTEFQ